MSDYLTLLRDAYRQAGSPSMRRLADRCGECARRAGIEEEQEEGEPQRG